jgi:hypothetical protein
MLEDANLPKLVYNHEKLDADSLKAPMKIIQARQRKLVGVRNAVAHSTESSSTLSTALELLFSLVSPFSVVRAL